jgi:rfaE bifunctional protein kinase chain/domain
LQWAKRLGDRLLVTISADQAINKGPGRPYVNERLRAENLAVLEFVDWVYIAPEPTAAETLAHVRPDIYVKGNEYRWSDDPRFLNEKSIVDSYGGRVVYSSGDVVFSSTRIISDLADDWTEGLDQVDSFRQRHSVDEAGLATISGRFDKVRALVVGDVIRDEYIWCDATHISGEAPAMNLTRLGQAEFWGGAAIVSQHLRGLGADVDLVTNIGQDAASRKFAEDMETSRIRIRDCSGRTPVVSKTRFLVEQSKVLKVDDPAPPLIDETSMHDALDDLLASEDKIDVAFLCDFGYGAVGPAFLQEELPKIRSRVPVVIGDVSGRRSHLTGMNGVNLLCPSEREVREAFDDYTSGLSVLASQLIHQTNAKDVIITLDRNGLVVFEGKAEAREPDGTLRLPASFLPAISRNALDSLGCGDALLATSGLALAAGGSVHEAALLGSFAAAWEAEHMGNIPIDLFQLQERAGRHLDAARRSRHESPIRIDRDVFAGLAG